jgi:uncharacterized membrane protein
MVRKNAEGSGETALETWISYVLIAGVTISLILETAGIILFYRAAHSAAVSEQPAMFVHGRDFFTFFGSLLTDGSSHGTPGLHLMVLGIAILILTPYVRAVMSVVYFAAEKNLTYFFITLFVLIVLTVSLLVH